MARFSRGGKQDDDEENTMHQDSFEFHCHKDLDFEAQFNAIQENIILTPKSAASDHSDRQVSISFISLPIPIVIHRCK
jgi:hypothetical protein